MSGPSDESVPATEREPVEVYGASGRRWLPLCRNNCGAPVHPVYVRGVWFWAHVHGDAQCDAPSGPDVVSDPTTVWEAGDDGT